MSSVNRLPKLAKLFKLHATEIVKNETLKNFFNCSLCPLTNMHVIALWLGSGIGELVLHVNSSGRCNEHGKDT